MEKLSLIIPCYNEEESLPIVYKALCDVSAEMKKNSFEFIFVDDGSKDATLRVIKSFAADKRVKYISFSRNFGKESAMLAGLEAAGGDYVAVMDADMQDPPSLLPQMLSVIKEKGVDSVATRRVTREGEPPVRSFFANLFYKIFRKMSDLDVKSGSRDFRLMTRKMADAVISMAEDDRFSKGIFEWVGFKTEWLPYKNTERVAGVTKWSFAKLFRYAVGGFLSFTVKPLKLPMNLGMVAVAVAFVWTVIQIILCCNGFAAGIYPLMILMIFLAGVILISLGIMGEYLARIYTASRNRPRYIIGESNIKK